MFQTHGFETIYSEIAYWSVCLSIEYTIRRIRDCLRSRSYLYSNISKTTMDKLLLLRLPSRFLLRRVMAGRCFLAVEAGVRRKEGHTKKPLPWLFWAIQLSLDYSIPLFRDGKFESVCWNPFWLVGLCRKVESQHHFFFECSSSNHRSSHYQAWLGMSLPSSTVPS